MDMTETFSMVGSWKTLYPKVEWKCHVYGTSYGIRKLIDTPNFSWGLLAGDDLSTVNKGYKCRLGLNYNLLLDILTVRYVVISSNCQDSKDTNTTSKKFAVLSFGISCFLLRRSIGSFRSLGCCSIWRSGKAGALKWRRNYFLNFFKVHVIKKSYWLQTPRQFV